MICIKRWFQPVLLALLVTVLTVLWTARGAWSETVSVESKTQLAPTGTISWGDFGDGGTLVPSGSTGNVKSLSDQTTLDTYTLDSGAGADYTGPYLIYNVIAGDSYSQYQTGENFTPGDRALDANWYNFGSDPRVPPGSIINRPWEFFFTQPVAGFGVQSNPTQFGGGFASITAFDSNGHILGQYSESTAGLHSPYDDSSAPFFGILSNAVNISRVEFDASGGDGEAMIDSPFVRMTADPNSVTLLKGDFNRDGKVTNADVQAMLDALKDLNTYKQTYFLTDADLLAIGDLNQSGAVDAGDINPLMQLLATGNYTPPPQLVPEPSTLVLAGIAAAAGLFALRRRQ